MREEAGNGLEAHAFLARMKVRYRVRWLLWGFALGVPFGIVTELLQEAVRAC